jgi:CHAD domain-containing protein
VDYRSRWDVMQADFIDEPRKAVTGADTLVGEMLDHLAETFREQRQTLEQHWADDESSTVDLRIALRRYRTFFKRLLSL